MVSSITVALAAGISFYPKKNETDKDINKKQIMIKKYDEINKIEDIIHSVWVDFQPYGGLNFFQFSNIEDGILNAIEIAKSGEVALPIVIEHFNENNPNDNYSNKTAALTIIEMSQEDRFIDRLRPYHEAILDLTKKDKEFDYAYRCQIFEIFKSSNDDVRKNLRELIFNKKSDQDLRARAYLGKKSTKERLDLLEAQLMDPEENITYKRRLVVYCSKFLDQRSEYVVFPWEYERFIEIISKAQDKLELNGRFREADNLNGDIIYNFQGRNVASKTYDELDARRKHRMNYCPSKEFVVDNKYTTSVDRRLLIDTNYQMYIKEDSCNIENIIDNAELSIISYIGRPGVWHLYNSCKLPGSLQQVSVRCLAKDTAKVGEYFYLRGEKDRAKKYFDRAIKIDSTLKKDIEEYVSKTSIASQPPEEIRVRDDAFKKMQIGKEWYLPYGSTPGKNMLLQAIDLDPKIKPFIDKFIEKEEEIKKQEEIKANRWREYLK
jgi:tetratricopeptide (TPR) repeat protein